MIEQMRGSLVLVTVLLGGCVEAHVLPCGDLICPDDELCLDGTHCVPQGAVVACDGASVGDGCSVDNLFGRCADLGGGLVCDPATCGDGVIDTPLREACDGAAAFDTQCVDLGYDLGRPACGPACELDPAPCTRFGWGVVVDAPVSAMWTDGTILAYVRHDPDGLDVHGGAFDLSLAISVAELHGGGGRVFLRMTDASLVEVTPGGLVPIETAPLFDARDVSSTAVDETGALYALIDCAIWRFDTSWTRIMDRTGFCTTVLTGPGPRVYVIEYGDLVDEAVAGNYNQAFRANAPIHAVRFTSTGAYIGTTDNLQSWTYGDFSTRVIATGDVRSIGVAGNQTFAALADGTALRFDGSFVDILTPPTSALSDDGHGGLYSYIGPIYRYSGVTFGDLAPLPLAANHQITGAQALPSGDIVASSTLDVWMVDPGGTVYDRLATFDAVTHAVAGIAFDELVVATFDATHPPELRRVHGTGTFGRSPISGASAVYGLWMGSDRVAYAAGITTTGGWLGFDDPLTGIWTSQQIAGCAFYDVDGAGTRVIAAGTCGGEPSLWELQGTAWTELHREPGVTGSLRAVRVLPSGDVFSTGDEVTLWQQSGAWKLDASVHGRSMSGAADDIWLSGSFTPVQHWDGHVWSKMTTRPLGPIAIAASTQRVVMAGAALGHVALLRE